MSFPYSLGGVPAGSPKKSGKVVRRKGLTYNERISLVTNSIQASNVFDALLASLQKAAEYHHDDAVSPAAILWPDEKREWERLVPRLRMVLPHFFVFGPYDQANRTGPAIWLRCVLAGKVPNISVGRIDNPSYELSGSVPILYLPGVSRATLGRRRSARTISSRWPSCSTGASSGLR